MLTLIQSKNYHFSDFELVKKLIVHFATFGQVNKLSFYALFEQIKKLLVYFANFEQDKN